MATLIIPISISVLIRIQWLKMFRQLFGYSSISCILVWIHWNSLLGLDIWLEDKPDCQTSLIGGKA
jgi:hypothetical protein